MRALMKTAKGPGNIAVQEIPVPELPDENWVLIEVKAAGVCGTDLHIWHDEFPCWPPVVMGHEFSGTIVRVGKNAGMFKPGDRVVAEPHSLACGVCELCRQGHIQICPSKRSPGWGINGAFTDYLVMPSHLLHRIPEKLPFDIAALAEPMAITVHQVLERSTIECQDFVVITGSGPIGIMAAFAAKAAGASKVVVTGMGACKAVRFPAALSLGADFVVNVEQDDPVEFVKDLTKGRGADLVVETSGAEPAIKQSVDLVRTRGRITAIGIPKKETVAFPWTRAMHKVIDVRFNMSSSYTSWDRALSLMAGTSKNLRQLITHTTTINHWKTVFDDLEAERGIKALFIPEA